MHVKYPLSNVHMSDGKRTCSLSELRYYVHSAARINELAGWAAELYINKATLRDTVFQTVGSRANVTYGVD